MVVFRQQISKYRMGSFKRDLREPVLVLSHNLKSIFAMFFLYFLLLSFIFSAFFMLSSYSFLFFFIFFMLFFIFSCFSVKRPCSRLSLDVVTRVSKIRVYIMYIYILIAYLVCCSTVPGRTAQEPDGTVNKIK